MKRVLCWLLLLTLLTGCAEVPERTWEEQFDNGRPETATIAYIPLDNRPVNTTRVAFLAQSAGFRLLVPDAHLYRTALDGQQPNPNGTQYGDGEALLQWIERTEADYYVISVDQILSGGLVNSRWMTEITDEQQKIDRLLAALKGKQGVLLDTVMRLAPTVGYGGYTLREYEALREYGKKPRPSLEGALTPEWIIANYHAPTDLDGGTVSRYQETRSRKLKLSAYLLSALTDQERILLFYGIDDSSPGNTIQTNEIAFIEQNLKHGQIFAGTDEMGLMAVARVIRDHYKAQPMPKVGIRYFGADPDAPADAYDTGDLKSNLGAHLEALDLQWDQRDGDVELLVFGGNCPEKLLTHYKDNLKKGLPTMIVDLGEKGCLPREMLADEDLDFGCLLSYSAWNTAGNAIGIALSNGIARFLYLQNESDSVRGANAGFLKGLAFGLAKDISYAQVLHQIEPEASQQALKLVQEGNDLAFENIAAMLEGKQFLTSVNPQEMRRIPRIAVAGICFPWNRTFEADLEIQIGATGD